jgi:DNA-binding transcriptional ArsR family regulator
MKKMPTVKPQGKRDKLTDQIEVEVLPVCDMHAAITMLTFPGPSRDEAPKEWVARVRRRFQPETLKTLDEIGWAIPITLTLQGLPHTIERFLEFLENIPAENFVDELLRIEAYNHISEQTRQVFEKCRKGEAISPDEFKILEEETNHKELAELLVRVAPELTDQARTKKRMLEALRDFYESYYREEWERISPPLLESASRARSLIETRLLSTRQIIDSLTNGFVPAEGTHYKRIVLAPGFFSAPYITYLNLPDEGLLIVYPARPEGMQIDGSRVDSERLLQRLKVLADKTRLEILQLLAKRPYYTQELAEVLKLSQPTISYHMRDLRVAGIVITEQNENSKLYRLRPEFIDQLAEDLKLKLGL